MLPIFYSQNTIVTSHSSERWYCPQPVCLCVCVCINKPESGSGYMSCSLDHHISGCEYFSLVKLFRWVSKISLQPLKTQTRNLAGVWLGPNIVQVEFEDGCGTSTVVQ